MGTTFLLIFVYLLLIYLGGWCVETTLWSLGMAIQSHAINLRQNLRPIENIHVSLTGTHH